MEEDLRAQEEFYRSGEKPSATVVRKNPERADQTAEKNGIQLSSILSPVREIKERVVIRERKNLESGTQESGFPTAQRINVTDKSNLLVYRLIFVKEERNRSSDNRWKKRQNRNR